MNTKILCDKSLLDNIGDAIRSRVGTTDKMTITQLATGAGYNEDLTTELAEQAEVIASLEEAVAGKAGGGSAVLESLAVTENGTYKPSSGVDGFNEVIVNVANSGGSQPSGVCPSLTITGYSDLALEFIFYSSGGRYYSDALVAENYTLTNVDVNQVIVIKYRTRNTDSTVLKTTNIEVLQHVSSQNVILKCTSTDAATLTIEKDASSPWG